MTVPKRPPSYHLPCRFCGTRDHCWFDKGNDSMLERKLECDRCEALAEKLGRDDFGHLIAIVEHIHSEYHRTDPDD
jgi:hypothetical protein